MADEAARDLAKKRLKENWERIVRQCELIERLKTGGRATDLAEEVLGNLKRSHALLKERYVSLGGKVD